MRAFIDFEASSLGRHGYPIEVAWVFEDGASETFLIRPAEMWTDWDPAAEAIHGISREMLWGQGVAHDTVAKRVMEALGGHEVFATAPSWDGKWMSRLLRSAGLPRHAVRLVDTEIGHEKLAAALLEPFVPSSEIHRAIRKLLANVAQRFDALPPQHRALPDARRERDRWLAVSTLAHNWPGVG